MELNISNKTLIFMIKGSHRVVISSWFVRAAEREDLSGGCLIRVGTDQD
jgi:hypothetical protein